MRCVVLNKAHVAGYWRTTEHGQRVWVEGYDTRRMRHEPPVHHEAATTGTRAVVVDAATMAEMTQAEQAKARARRQKIARGLSDSELASRRLELEQQGVHHGLNRQRLTEHQRVWLSLVQEQERRVREAKEKPPPPDVTPPEDTPPPTLREKRWNEMTREDLLDRYRSASDLAQNRHVKPAERLRWQIEADTLSSYLQRRFPDWTPHVPPPPPPPPKQRKDMTHAECFATFQHHLRESENDQLNSAQRSFHRMDAHSMAAHMRQKWPDQADPVNLHRWSEMHEAALVQELVQLVGFTLNDRIPPLEQQQWKKQADHLAAHIKERFPGRVLPTTPVVPPEPPTPPPTPPKPPLRRAPNWTRLGKPKRDIWQTTNVTEGRYHNEALNHPNVSAGVVAAIQKAPALMKVVDQPEKTESYYLGQMHVDSCTVVMGDRQQGSTYKEATWRHEFGHHLDRVMHGDIPPEVYRQYTGRYAGQRYASMDAVKAIAADGDALVQAHEQRYANETYELRDKLSMAMSQRIREAMEKSGGDETAALQEEMTRAGLDPKEIYAMYPLMQNRRAWLTELLVGLETKNPYWAIPNAAVDHGARGMLEDFCNAITGGRLKFTVGHPDSYYNDGVKTSVPGYTENHTTEAFANWFHMHGAPQTFFRVIMKKLAPETCAAFEKRVNTWLTT